MQSRIKCKKNEPFSAQVRRSSTIPLSQPRETPDEQLLRFVEHNQFLPFGTYSKTRKIKKWKKIGEGVFGEVFIASGVPSVNQGKPFVVKIVPMNSSTIWNGAALPSLKEVLNEVIVTRSLSDLRKDQGSSTEGFVELLSAFAVRGRFPADLLRVWDTSSKRKKTSSTSCFAPSDRHRGDRLRVNAELFEHLLCSYPASRRVSRATY